MVLHCLLPLLQQDGKLLQELLLVLKDLARLALAILQGVVLDLDAWAKVLSLWKEVELQARSLPQRVVLHFLNLHAVVWTVVDQGWLELLVGYGGLLLVEQVLVVLEVGVRLRGVGILLLDQRLVLEVLPPVPGLHLVRELDDLLVSAADLLDCFVSDVLRELGVHTQVQHLLGVLGRLTALRLRKLARVLGRYLGRLRLVRERVLDDFVL